MASTYPTKYELRCSGTSLILSQVLLCIGWALSSLKYDIYDVKNDEDVIKLHNALSDPIYRIRTEICVTCLWISFPLYLIALFGLKKNGMTWFRSSSGEMYVYLFEKAYIIWLTIAMILIPALQLVVVSYDWSFDEPSQQIVSPPTGYYIQLFIITLQFEIVDCMAVADAVFLISLFIMGLIMTYGAYSNKPNGNNNYNQIWKQYYTEMSVSNKPFIDKLVGCCCTISSFIIFLIILFQFAGSGFFSITGYAKFLLIWVFICKMGIGAELIYAATNKKYSLLKKIHEKKYETDNVLNDNTIPNDDKYQMEQININTENNDEL